MEIKEKISIYFSRRKKRVIAITMTIVLIAFLIVMFALRHALPETQHEEVWSFVEAIGTFSAIIGAGIGLVLDSEESRISCFA